MGALASTTICWPRGKRTTRSGRSLCTWTFSARASLAYRSSFLTEGPTSQGNLWQYTEGATRLDASTSYTVNDYVKVSLEALNLLDTPGSARVDVDAKRRDFYGKTGRTYLLGARFNY